MLTCFIRYQIDPTKKAMFEEYARNWGKRSHAVGLI